MSDWSEHDEAFRAYTEFIGRHLLARLEPIDPEEAS